MQLIKKYIIVMDHQKYIFTMYLTVLNTILRILIVYQLLFRMRC